MVPVTEPGVDQTAEVDEVQEWVGRELRYETLLSALRDAGRSQPVRREP